MSLPARITDFQPLATILSSEVDSEFNNLVNILNGTDQTKNIRVRSNDNSFAVARFDQLASSANILEFFSGGVEVGRVEKDGDLVCLGLSGAAGIYTFSSIPVGPSSNPTTDNQFARKKYVDDKIAPFVITYKIDDPSTFGINDNVVLPFVRIPAITGGFINKIHIWYQSGSHTSGGSVTFKPSISGVGNIGSGVSFNNSNATIFTVYTDDFTDQSISEGSMLNAVISARSGVITERDVSINIEGFRKLS